MTDDTNTVVTLPERAWTAGPWAVQRRGPKDRERAGVVEQIAPDVIEPLVADYGGDWWLDVSDADADLMALSPLLAEAVLSMTEACAVSSAPCYCTAEIHEMADMLNRIEAS